MSSFSPLSQTPLSTLPAAAPAGSTIHALAAGGAISGASAQLSVRRAGLASGGSLTGGAATMGARRGELSAGGSISGGVATLSIRRGELSTGGSISGGTAQLSVRRGLLAAGASLSGGTGSTQRARGLLAAGAALSAGSGSLQTTRGLAAGGASMTAGIANLAVSVINTAPLAATDAALSGGTADLRIIPPQPPPPLSQGAGGSYWDVYYGARSGSKRWRERLPTGQLRLPNVTGTTRGFGSARLDLRRGLEAGARTASAGRAIIALIIEPVASPELADDELAAVMAAIGAW